MTEAQIHTRNAPPPGWLEKVRIRPAQATDLPGLEWEGEFAHFRQMYAEVFQRCAAGRAAMWLADLPSVGLVGQAFVQFSRFRAAGRFGHEFNRAYVHGFRVRPAYRNAGLGACIMDILEADLHQRGVSGITLNVVAENAAARRFYERRGYRVIARDPGRWSYVDQYGITREIHEPGWRMLKTLNTE